jgi:hypothetical protein
MLTLHEVAGDDHRSSRFIEVDARGHFVAEFVPPGTYELTIGARTNPPPFAPVSRTITIANGAETQVVLVVNLAKKVGP